MKIIHFDKRKEEAKLLVEGPEDLWFVSRIIDAGDIVKGKTLRKIKAPVEGGEASRRAVFIALVVEKIEYSPEAVRVSGKIVEGPEDVPRGSYHTFSIEQGAVFTLAKQAWPSYQLALLKEAAESKPPKILICVFDREEALFAVMKRSGYELLGRLKGDVAKKRVELKAKGDFYEKIIENLVMYDERYKLDRIVLASPAFWKEELFKVLKNEALKKKIVQATCSSADESAIAEVLKRDELKEALRQERISRELRLVEEVMAEIAKGGKAAYGIDAVENAVLAGAVEKLLITDKTIFESKNTGNFERINNLIKNAEKAKGEITIVSSEHSGGKMLDGMGGIAALLRYKLYSE